MEQIDKEKLWRKLSDPQTTKKQAFELLQGFADYWFSKGWRRHRRLKNATQVLKAQRMKEEFDEWYDKNIAKYTMEDLEAIQQICYTWMEEEREGMLQSHSPKNPNYE